jgi:hypothetical protein
VTARATDERRSSLAKTLQPDWKARQTSDRRNPSICLRKISSLRIDAEVILVIGPVD